jgi:hypothetical protein
VLGVSPTVSSGAVCRREAHRGAVQESQTLKQRPPSPLAPHYRGQIAHAIGQEVRGSPQTVEAPRKAPSTLRVHCDNNGLRCENLERLHFPLDGASAEPVQGLLAAVLVIG